MPLLETVDISSNGFTVLPDSLANLPALQHLDLSHNQLVQLPPGLLQSLPSLRSLAVQGNPLEAAEAAAVASHCASAGVVLRES